MEVRFFKKSEKQLLLDSIDRLWRHNHVYVRQPEVLEHLVLNTPYRVEYAGEDNYSFIGMWDSDNNVIGLSGATPQKINVFGEEYDSMTGTIWYVDRNNPEANGIVLKKFLLKDKPAMDIGLGVSDIALKIYRALGYNVIDQVPRWVGANSTQLKNIAENLLLDGDDISYMPVLSSIKIESGYTVTNNISSKEWDDFYYNTFAPMTVGTQRDYRFLKWRYMESPILKYRFFVVRNKSERCEGLAVVRYEKILDNKFTIGRILEFISVTSDSAIALASAVVESDLSVLFWDFYCLSDITAYGLETVGFRKLPIWMDKLHVPSRFQPIDNFQLNGIIGLSKKLQKSLGSFNNNKWYITKGDCDQDRAN